MRIEQAILSNLIQSEEYCRKVVPHLKKEYFSDRKEAAIASLLLTFFEKYNKPASLDIVAIEIGNMTGFTDKEVPEMNLLFGAEGKKKSTRSTCDWMILRSSSPTESRRKGVSS
jgi:hypothetical protein